MKSRLYRIVTFFSYNLKKDNQLGGIEDLFYCIHLLLCILTSAVTKQIHLCSLDNLEIENERSTKCSTVAEELIV
jgi:hypothetical protein